MRDDAERWEAERGAAKEEGSYWQILRSTALIGASALINVVFSVLRFKAFAVMLGPSGIGLLSLYNSILDLAQGVSGVGVQSSGVRQIAEAVGSQEERRIAVTAMVVRRICLVLGIVGGLALALLAIPVSTATFGSTATVSAVAILGLAVLCRQVSGGQLALMQGVRRIGSLAWVSTLGAAGGTITAIPIVYVWDVDGIAPSLVVMAAVSLAASWWYRRKIPVAEVAISWREFRSETSALLRLGLVFMVSAVLTLASAYVVRWIVLQHDGLVAAGLYQAAWTIGGLYASFILQAMGTDFYPRLTAVCHEHEKCNRLVNEQAQVSMLLAGPGVLATLTLAPMILSLLYSNEFVPAVDLLRWICLGMMLRVLAWPMGYIIVAKAAERTFFWTEIAATTVHVGLAWLLVRYVGLSGAGLAFFGLYVWHSLLVYVLVRRMTGFRWSRANLGLIALFFGASALLLAAFAVLPVIQAGMLGAIATLVCGICSLRMLLGLLPASKLPAPLRSLMPGTPATSG